jgi:hypothetical protein
MGVGSVIGCSLGAPILPRKTKRHLVGAALLKITLLCKAARYERRHQFLLARCGLKNVMPVCSPFHSRLSTGPPPQANFSVSAPI